MYMRTLSTVIISILSAERAFAEITQLIFFVDLMSFKKILSFRDPGDLIVNSSFEIMYSVLKYNKIITPIIGKHIADPTAAISNDPKIDPHNKIIEYTKIHSASDNVNILPTEDP